MFRLQLLFKPRGQLHRVELQPDQRVLKSRRSRDDEGEEITGQAPSTSTHTFPSHPPAPPQIKAHDLGIVSQSRHGACTQTREWDMCFWLLMHAMQPPAVNLHRLFHQAAAGGAFRLTFQNKCFGHSPAKIQLSGLLCLTFALFGNGNHETRRKRWCFVHSGLNLVLQQLLCVILFCSFCVNPI